MGQRSASISVDVTPRPQPHPATSSAALASRGRILPAYLRLRVPARLALILVIALTPVVVGSVMRNLMSGDLEPVSQRVTKLVDGADMRPHRALISAHHNNGSPVIQIRSDTGRNRLWVLTAEEVHVYDMKSHALIRRVSLPKWGVVAGDYACPPDLAIDPDGVAFVSNNVQPRLLQIDPVDFQITEHEFSLVTDKQWDIGFGALAFGPDGSLYAFSALGGLMFELDLVNQNATEMPPSHTRARASGYVFDLLCDYRRLAD